MDGRSVVHVRPVPPFVAGIAKPLIVISALLLTLPLILRRRRLAATDPLLALAFALLLRCVLDPFDNPYYHLPFLFAFLAWEALTVRGVPCRSVRFVRVPAPNAAGGRFHSIPDYTVHCAYTRVVASAAGLHGRAPLQPGPRIESPRSAQPAPCRI